MTKIFNLEFVISQYKAVPKSVKVFLFKSLVLYTVWVCAYHLFLEPHRVIDPYLTNTVGFLTYKIVQVIFSHHAVTFNFVESSPFTMIDGKSNLMILDGCNGLELYVFFIGFIVCYPAPLNVALKFIVGGSLGIFILNLSRCVALACMQHFDFKYLEAVHHYLFTIIVYSFILLLWVNYLKANFNSTVN